MELKQLMQYASVEEIDDEEVDTPDLENTISGSLRTLFEEAGKDDGDPVSKRIVDEMDEWLKSYLQQAIDDQIEKEKEPEF